MTKSLKQDSCSINHKLFFKIKKYYGGNLGKEEIA